MNPLKSTKKAVYPLQTPQEEVSNILCHQETQTSNGHVGVKGSIDLIFVDRIDIVYI